MQFNFLPGFFTALFIPVLILIHSLRHKPVKKQVTTLFIWEAILQEKKSAVFFDSLLKNISLLLQVIIVCLLTLALAEPVIFMKTPEPPKHILIIDTSASMKTRISNTVSGPAALLTPSDSRFEQARKAALSKIDALTDAGSLMIIDAGKSPKVILPFSTDKHKMRQVIADLAATDVRSDMKKAVYLALSFYSADNSGRIFLITDGAGYDPEYDMQRLVSLNDAIVPVRISGGKKNYAITRFEVRPRPGRKSVHDILIRVNNFSTEAVICPLIVKTGNTILFEQNVGLDGRKSKTLVTSFDGKIKPIVSARIMVTDDLAVDNMAWAVLQPQEKTRVFLVSQGNYYLETLLNVFSDVSVSISPTIPEASWERITAHNDIVILDGIEPPGGSKGNFLFINTTSSDVPVSVTGRVKNPKVVDWRMDAAVTKGVNLDRLYIESAMQLTPAGHQADKVFALLESKETALISQFYTDRFKAVLIGFDINQSDLPLRVAFPVLIKNIFAWLHPGDRPFLSTHILSGTPIRVDIKRSGKPVSIRRPSNTWEKITVHHPAPDRKTPENEAAGKTTFVYPKTDEVGIYKLKENRNSHYFAVNLLDEKESDIAASGRIETNDEIQAKRLLKKARVVEKPLWQFCLLMVLGFCIAETLIWIKKE